jgi:RNA polymerase sigma-70 factor, ECF subfamily
MSSETAAYFPDALASTAERQCSVCDHEEQPTVETAAIAPRAAAQSTESSDEELLEEISRGGREALGLLFRRHARSVRNVAQRILRDEAEAEDLLQDIFLFIFRKAALFDSSRGSARSWIFQVAYHRAFNRRQYLASRHFYTALQLDEEILGPGSDAAETPFYALAIDGLLGKQLQDKFITRLSPDQRRTLELFFFEGYTLKDIAERTGQPLGNVRSYYYRGLERLRAYVLPAKVRSK